MENLITRSRDHGKTWSVPEPMADEGHRLPRGGRYQTEPRVTSSSIAPAARTSSTSARTDGKTWDKAEHAAIAGRRLVRWMCRGKDGRLLAGAYVTQDENHLYYCTSDDGGRTWSKQRKAPLDKSIRDPELAYLNGKYYLHGTFGTRRPRGASVRAVSVRRRRQLAAGGGYQRRHGGGRTATVTTALSTSTTRTSRTS